ADVRQRYREAALDVLLNMTPTAVRHLYNNCREWHFYPDYNAIEAAFRARGGTGWRPAGAFYEPRTQSVHLDDANGPEELRDYYAHEFCHAMDYGRGYPLQWSDTEAWQRAWNADLRHGAMIPHGGSPGEGWSRFGEWVLTGTPTDRLILAAQHRNCAI